MTRHGTMYVTDWSIGWATEEPIAACPGCLLSRWCRIMLRGARRGMAESTFHHHGREVGIVVGHPAPEAATAGIRIGDRGYGFLLSLLSLESPRAISCLATLQGIAGKEATTYGWKPGRFDGLGLTWPGAILIEETGNDQDAEAQALFLSVAHHVATAHRRLARRGAAQN